MGLFNVDEKKCKKDGLCVDECPMGIIEMGSGSSFPSPANGADELCIHCGHCVSICPHGALSHKSMAPGGCPPVNNDWRLNPEQVEHFLRSRRSIRTYREQTVDRKILAKLIDIGRYAPSGHNTQPVRWMVITDPREVQHLASHVADWMAHLVEEGDPLAHSLHMDRAVVAWHQGLDRICRGAPHLMITHAPKNERTAPVACTIALSHVELAAPSFGLGACWGGYFNLAANLWPPMQEFLALPQGHLSLGAMMLEYPKYKYQRLPLRNEAQTIWR